jgi:transcriptional regulator with XRE-family HTH domain
LQFNEYLKKCREQNDHTQEQLVHALYIHDIEHFEALDAGTLGKWERGVTKPKALKQVSIIRYFQEITGNALPCFDDYNVNETEELICKVGIKNILGNSKELVLNFPAAMIGANDLNVYQLRNTEMIDEVIDINMDLDKDFNHDTTQFRPEQFKEWALHPSSSFYTCQYKGQFFGLLFTLRLKPEVFERIMDQEIDEKDLTVDDFASFEEMGCNLMVSFFAMNEKSAAMLFIRYYAHLIANQKVIAEVGLATMMEDAKKLIRNMNLHHHGSKSVGEGLMLQTYRETLPIFLSSEEVVRMVLSKQECPEE